MPRQSTHRASGVHFLRYCGYILFVFEILLGVAHLLWPEYRWGQGRHSYFNFANSLTLASWLVSMQLVGVAICSLIAFQRERYFSARPTASWSSRLWLAGALLALGLSVAEMTRFHHRFRLFGYPNPKLYHHFILFPALLVALLLFGVFLLSRRRTGAGMRTYIIGWLAAWGLERVLATLYSLAGHVLREWETLVVFFRGEAYLLGCTALLLAVGTYVIQAENVQSSPTLPQTSHSPDDFLSLQPRLPILIGVAGTTAALIFFQVILFQLLNIFGDYLTANSVIAIAMLGIAMGGLIAAYGNNTFPRATLVSATLLFPVSILFAFGTAVSLAHSPFLASVLLMMPFLCGSVVITIVLVRAQSHLVYFIDLTGAAVGTICVSSALWHFREESSLFFLAAFASLVALCVILACRFKSRFRRLLFATALLGACVCAIVGLLNLRYDWFNIIRTKIRRSYPQAQIYFSRSSFGGRYDVILRKPHYQSLSAYENGRITDTIRSRPADHYRIDPRLPHTLIHEPSILIIGLSGDGIIKTSKFIGKSVTGVEINPAVVSLQTNELRHFNADSYQDVEVAVMDARSFLEQSQETYDMITLMNTHTSRGSAAGRAASPEYMDTYEAMNSYLDHLTERGVVVFEEPVNWPRREPSIWKLLVTMRQVLLDRGSPAPERHVFVFQWRTRTNNYIQIVLKKNPLSDDDIAKLKQWLHDVDHIKWLEAAQGQKLGPITSTTTLLHSPDLRLSTNYAGILRGEATPRFLNARNLKITTDDRPFHFDVDPTHPELKAAYTRTLLMTVGIVPCLLLFFRNRHFDQRLVVIFVLAVMLAGIGYFFIEVALIQWFAFFLGTPVTTFSTVLGTLLFFSGLGSLWSGRIRHSGLYAAFALIPLLLLALLGGVPVLFRLATSWPLWQKVCLSILCLAPLAFCMGVPFPWILRSGKARFTASAAPILFGLNAAAGALAVPLSMNLTTSYGFRLTFSTGIVVYIALGFLLYSGEKRGRGMLTAGLASLVIAALLLSPWLSGMAVTPNSSENAPLYRVYAVRYGTSSYPEEKILRGSASTSSLPFAWMFWVIQGEGRTILVDTGFEYDAALLERWGISNYVRPVEQLQKLGIAPSDVSDIILTHGHWDHIGGLKPFESAQIRMQQKEYEHLQALSLQGTLEKKGFREHDVQFLNAAKRDGRLHLLNGNETLAPGISMTLSGGHTPGSQYVTVETLDGSVILAGDETYLYKNNRRHIPIGSAFDPHANMAAITTMHGLAASPFYIVPGHDPRVMQYFPKQARDIVHIVAVPE